MPLSIPEHHEQRLLRNHRLDATGLQRLGAFFLVHTSVDIRLIALVIEFERRKAQAKSQRRGKQFWLDEIRANSVRWSGGTFTEHLKRVRERRLVPEVDLGFPEEINRARDGFVHFQVGRFKLPQYQGQAVISDEGYKRFMTDAAIFDINVPFPSGVN